MRVDQRILASTASKATVLIQMLFDKGFWAAAHEARTDLSMLSGLVFLLIEGPGPLSIDYRVIRGLET